MPIHIHSEQVLLISSDGCLGACQLARPGLVPLGIIVQRGWPFAGPRLVAFRRRVDRVEVILSPLRGRSLQLYVLGQKGLPVLLACLEIAQDFLLIDIEVPALAASSGRCISSGVDCGDLP